jgi:hypothetical protein
MIQKFANGLFLLAVFLLPWQTQVILSQGTVSGEPSPYAVLSLSVAEVMIAIVFLLRWKKGSDAHRPLTQALSLFLAVAFFSLTLSRFSSVGWFHMIHVVSAAMLFLLMLDKYTQLKPTLVAFLIGLFVPSVIAWLQVTTGQSPDSTLLGMAAKDAQTLGVAVVETAQGRMLRGYGTFPHPNIFGGYLAVGVVVLAWLTRFVRGKRALIFMLAGAVALGPTLIITFSRSAWLGLTVGLIVLMILMWRQKKMPPRFVIPVLSLGVVCVLVTVALFHQEVFARFNPSLRLEAISIEERASQYQMFGSVFFSSPIFGVGPNAYTFTLAHQDPGNPVWSYQPIHNVLFLILAELGVVGFVLFAVWIHRISRMCFRSVQTPNSLFALSLGLSLLMIAFFDHYLWSLWPGLALSAFVLGLIVRFE